MPTMQPPRPSLNSSRALRGALLLCGLLAACAPQGCPGTTTGGTSQCRLDRDCGIDQLCQDGSCVDKRVCHGDTECDPEQRCDALTGSCIFRTGFAHDCGPNNNNLPCAAGQFCALGLCRDTSTAKQCSRRFQCGIGEVCDRESFYCIEENPCTLATSPTRPYPELACDPGENCDVATGACIGSGPPECDPVAVPTGCASDELCNGARRCVQCISNVDCGAGLRCNTRAGLCESTNTCRSDSECRSPLVCDRATAVCAVPLPPCTSDFNCALGQFCDRTAGTCQYKEGKCTDDRFEENDTTVNGRDVDLSNAQQTLSDLMLCPNDPDVWKVTLSAGDQLSVVLSGARPQARAEMWALAPTATGGGIMTLRYVEAPPRGNGTVSFVAEHDGAYFIRVISLAGQSAYQLAFTRTLGNACVEDAFDTPPLSNNLPFSASTLHTGLVDHLSLCSGDADWYLVQGATPASRSLKAGQAISVQLSGPASEDFDLQLTDAFGETVLAQGAGPSAEEFVRYRAAQDMDVLVGVTPYGPSMGNYSLTISIQNPFVCVADAYETYDHAPLMTTDAGTPDAAMSLDDGGPADAAMSLADASVDVDASVADAAVTTVDAGAVTTVGNNTRALAIPVDLSGLEADLGICRGDEDWFVVEARAHQRVLAQATFAQGENGVQLEGYDDTGLLLGTGRGATLAALSVPGNAAGRVFIRVVSPSGESPYHLSLQVLRRQDCEPDSAEPNNTPALASPPSLAADGVYTVCGTDVDLFRIQAGAGKRVKVDVDFSTADGDIDVALLLPDGTTVLAVSDGVTSHEGLDVVLPADPVDGGLGAYFLSVYAARSDTRAPYHLHTQILAN
jgi:hypothetical protein